MYQGPNRFGSYWASSTHPCAFVLGHACDCVITSLHADTVTLLMM